MMKRVLLFLLAILPGMNTMIAFGDEESQFKVTLEDSGYTLQCTVLSESEKTCMVEGNYERYWVDRDLVIPATVNGYTVTELADRAFDEYRFTSVTLPQTVVKLGDGAFGKCEFMERIVLSDAITALPDYVFNGCKSLKEMNIPAACTSIGDFAFCDICVEEIDIPASVTEVGRWVFYDSNVRRVTFHNAVADMNKMFFDSAIEEVNLLEGTIDLTECFSGCKNLKRLHIPASVTSLDNVARGCGSLEEITVAQGNTKWDSRDDCNALIVTATNELLRGCRNTTIPQSVTRLADFSFECADLTELVLPEWVTWVGWNAFAHCDKLTNVTLHNKLENSSSNLQYAFEGCTALQSFTLPANFTTVPRGLLADCAAVNTVSLPDGVTSIYQGAFYGCSSLKSITLPEGVTFIGDRAFCGSGLEQVYIPASVISVGEKAFDDSRSLTDVVFAGNPELLIRNLAFSTYALEHITFLGPWDVIQSWAFSYNDRTLKDVSVQAYMYEKILKSFNFDEDFICNVFVGFSGSDWAPFYATGGNFVVPDDIEVYIVTSIEEGKAVLQQVSTINEGQGVLVRLKPTASARRRAQGNMTRVDLRLATDEDTVEDYSARNLLTVTSASTSVAQQNDGKVNFLFDGTQFVRVAAGGTSVPMLTALLPVEQSKAGTSQQLNLNVQTTGITAPTSNGSANEALFTLDGIRVSKPLAKGIYVKGGRKVVINR